MKLPFAGEILIAYFDENPGDNKYRITETTDAWTAGTRVYLSNESFIANHFYIVNGWVHLYDLKWLSKHKVWVFEKAQTCARSDSAIP